MIGPDGLGILVDLEVRKRYARDPDARLIRREQVRREAAERVLADIKRRVRQWSQGAGTQ